MLCKCSGTGWDTNKTAASAHLDIPVYAAILVHILKRFQHRVHDAGYHDLIQALPAAKMRMAGTGAAVSHAYEVLHQELVLSV
jgi:hypothetical protein